MEYGNCPVRFPDTGSFVLNETDQDEWRTAARVLTGRDQSVTLSFGLLRDFEGLGQLIPRCFGTRSYCLHLADYHINTNGEDLEEEEFDNYELEEEDLVVIDWTTMTLTIQSWTITI
jgi:hypothetical protein